MPFGLGDGFGHLLGLAYAAAPWYPPKRATGAHCGLTGGSGSSRPSYSAVAYTMRPPTTVHTDSMSGIAASGTVK